jgi:hypothetical protein
MTLSKQLTEAIKKSEAELLKDMRPPKAKLAALQKKVEQFCNSTGMAFGVSPDGHSFMYPSYKGQITIWQNKRDLEHPISGQKWPAAVMLRQLHTIAGYIDSHTPIYVGDFLKSYKPPHWKPTLDEDE